MKLRTLAAIAVLLVGAVWLRNYVDWTPLLIPYRAAKLYAAPPDTTITVPVRGVTTDRIANTWHAPRPGGRRHEGVDIFAKRGAPVISATRGMIMRTPEGGLGGRAVFVLGPGGRTYYYAHLDDWAPDLTMGKLVEAGALLGFVGTTGNARNTSPHLHFGIYSAEGALNPLPLLADSGHTAQELTVSRNDSE